MGLSRREFLKTVSAGVVSLAGARAQAPVTRYTSKDGLLEAVLDARPMRGTLAGRTANFFAFNGLLPGPVLEARAGDTIRVRYTNELDDVSNIHYHGLRCSPNGFADNIFLELPPGESWNYDFLLPRNHLPGTYWYHPHVHGVTTRQLGAGLAGMILIRGDLDEIPEIAAAAEHLLVLKDFGVKPDGSVGPGPVLTVSGQVNPTLAIQQDGLARLRILNTSIDLYFRLRLEEHPLYLIATDGGALPEVTPVDELLVAPAERYDVLVKGDRPPGSYRLLYFPYQSVLSGDMPGMDHSGPDTGATIATVVYQGRAARPLAVPGRLTTIDPLPAPRTPARSFEFKTAQLPDGSFVLQINGKVFDHHRVDTQVVLETVEDWEIVNRDPMDHPVHLHTNAFQILGTDGQPERAWKDIMNVKALTNRRFRVRFEQYPGRTVYHCHRVAHGDLGMMGVIEMIDVPSLSRSRRR